MKLLLLCARNSARVCMSRSGEPDSPKRNMQGLETLPYSTISLRRGVLVLGDRSSRLGEYVSPKREFVCICVV